jgi:hypothetical protein
LLSCHADKLSDGGRQRLVRHSHLPLATTEPGTARLGGQQINVRWMMITDAGRRALAG